MREATVIDRDSYLSRKIVALSFWMSIMVVALHAFNYEEYNLTGMPRFIQMYMEYMCDVAVPIFFMTSGMLFYRNYTYKDTFKKYKSRFFSLYIPKCAWNIVAIFYFALITNIPAIGSRMNMPRVTLEPSTFVRGLFENKCFVMWFVSQLVYFAILAPVLYTFYKNKVVAMLFVGVIYGYILISGATGWELPVIKTGLSDYNQCYDLYPFIKADSLLYYSIGACLAIHAPKLPMKKWERNYGLMGLLVYLVLCVIKTYFDTRYNWNGAGAVLMILLSVMAFWMMVDMLGIERIDIKKPRYKHSFVIFAAHAMILEALQKIIKITLPMTVAMSFVNLMVPVAITVVAIIIIAELLDNYLHPVYRVLTGNR